MFLVESAPVSAAAIDVHDLGGTTGKWQEGTAVIDAPRTDVFRWLTEYDQWSRRFPDIQAVDVLSCSANRASCQVRFYSRIIGVAMTIQTSNSPTAIVYRGHGPSVTTQGKIFLSDAGPSRTRVVMQTTADVHGWRGMLVSEAMKRERAREKLRSDLTSLERLAQRSPAS